MENVRAQLGRQKRGTAATVDCRPTVPPTPFPRDWSLCRAGGKLGIQQGAAVGGRVRGVAENQCSPRRVPLTSRPPCPGAAQMGTGTGGHPLTSPTPAPGTRLSPRGPGDCGWREKSAPEGGGPFPGRAALVGPHPGLATPSHPGESQGLRGRGLFTRFICFSGKVKNIRALSHIKAEGHFRGRSQLKDSRRRGPTATAQGHLRDAPPPPATAGQS